MLLQILFAFLCSAAAGLAALLLSKLTRRRADRAAIAGLVFGLPLGVTIQLGADRVMRWVPLVHGLSIALCGVVFSLFSRRRQAGRRQAGA